MPTMHLVDLLEACHVMRRERVRFGRAHAAWEKDMNRVCTIFNMKATTQIAQTPRRRQHCVMIIIILEQIWFVLLLHLRHEYASAYTGNANHAIITCSSILYYLEASDPLFNNTYNSCD